MEAFVVDSIKRFLIKVDLPSVFCIYKQNRDVYNNGIDINRSDIDKLQDLNDNNSKNSLYLQGLHINDNKFVVVCIEELNGIYYVHSKSKEEGLVTIVGDDYSLFIYYGDEILPMLHCIKLDKLKKHINFIDRLLI
ncbi:MAG: hypothetical protein Terrestrivirus10_39 [Terrestrivirus sp.]|uniref:Uncharacterized protein n=1 Tax=Terrestrivirus sp. TaxID=2487775 RepID=A0A3G4ZP46_9VIRU|nr:MAG: hypothetical protein Terrestrivirus10_39 [Terrestrivirus sp.]